MGKKSCNSPTVRRILLAPTTITTMKIHTTCDPRCEHCGKPITTQQHITMERHSGPSTHHLHFHQECWRCPKCGTNGPHYCPADV
jgi:uncharacterized protein with PIN domain